MKRIYLVPLLSLLILPCFLAAQTPDFQQQRDSLLQVIKTAQAQEKLDAYTALTTKVLYPVEQSDSLFLYFKQAIREAQKQGNRQQEALFKTNYITLLYNYDRRKELMETAPDFLDFMAENDHWEHYYALYGFLLETYLNECRFETAMKEAQLLYDKASQQNNPAGMSTAAFIIGVVYQKMERYGDAEEYFRKTINILNGSQIDIPLLYDVYYVLSEVLSEQQQYSEALKTANELGNLIDRTEKKNNRTFPVLRYQHYLIQAMVYLEMGEFEKSGFLLDEAEKQLPDIDRALINIYYHKARIAELREEYPLALELCDEAFRLCEAIEEYAFSGDVIKIKYRVLSKMRKSEDLIDLFEQYSAIRDSVESQEFHARIDELRIQYEVDRHIAEKERNRDYFLFALGGCILFAIALGIWMYYSRQILRKNRELVRKAQLWANVTPVPVIVDADGETEPEEELPKTSEPNEIDRLLFAEIEQLIDCGLYKESNLSLDMLAGKTNQNTTYISKAVSRCTGKTFKTWLNEYRIKEAVRLLSDKNNPNISIETVAWDSGFNDRKTFHRIFKQTTGLSPSDFKKNGLRK